MSRVQQSPLESIDFIHNNIDKEHGLTPSHEVELKKLVKQYKRNAKCFDDNQTLKLGTKLVRNWKGKQHNVTVKTDGFEYQNFMA